MPAIRTVKQNDSAAAQALTAARPKKQTPKGPPKGPKTAKFESSKRDWAKYAVKIGTATRTIKFGYAFVLTDDHINDILSLDPQILENIEQFFFKYSDVSYGAENNAEALTNEAVILLAKACPNLKKVNLQATRHVTDDGLLGLVENCPDLTMLEITGSIHTSGRGKMTGSALDQLREHPDWVPELRDLIVNETEKNKPFMQAMRALGKERPELRITLLTRSEQKKWGDWELEEKRLVFVKGRLLKRW